MVPLNSIAEAISLMPVLHVFSSSCAAHVYTKERIINTIGRQTTLTSKKKVKLTHLWCLAWRLDPLSTTTYMLKDKNETVKNNETRRKGHNKK